MDLDFVSAGGSAVEVIRGPGFFTPPPLTRRCGCAYHQATTDQHLGPAAPACPALRSTPPDGGVPFCSKIILDNRQSFPSENARRMLGS